MKTSLEHEAGSQYDRTRPPYIELNESPPSTRIFKLETGISFKLERVSTPVAPAPVDAAGWEGLGALYYKLGAAVLVWDAERCEDRLAAQIAGASNTSDSGALSGQGGDPK